MQCSYVCVGLSSVCWVWQMVWPRICSVSPRVVNLYLVRTPTQVCLVCNKRYAKQIAFHPGFATQIAFVYPQLYLGNSDCLLNQPVKAIDEPYCGDYIVNQASEQCDCGFNATCDDPCCDAANCNLISGTIV